MPDPTLLVIFGASGDLTRRKLVPALFELMRDGMLPAGFAILGAARTPMTDDAFRSHLLEGMRTFEQLRPGEGPLWEALASGLFYHTMDPSRPGEYAGLSRRMGAENKLLAELR